MRRLTRRATSWRQPACGRRTYDVGQRDAGKLSGDAYGGLGSGPVFVLTHRPPSAPPDDQHSFLSGDMSAAVAAARVAAGGKDVEVLGSDVATSGSVTAMRYRVVRPTSGH